MNYYRDMWPSQSHTLAPLTDEIKRIVARNTLLTYPYFNETFKIHINASKFQLVVVIRHKGKPIALYGRK